MEETSFIEKLLLFGLSRQEATVYLCLLKQGEMTGYEVAKQTGISRSNVYNALASLVEHGAAYIMEGASTRYTPVSIEEFCDNRMRYLQEIGEYLLRNSPKPSLNMEGYITIEGNGHIQDKIHHMLCDAKSRIYFSAASSFLSQWQKEILSLVEKNIKVVLISDSIPRYFEEAVEQGKIIFYKGLSTSEEWEEKEKQIRLIIDSAYVLTGENQGASADTCLYSAQKNFVNVFKEAMSNEIRLIEMSGNEEKNKNGKESICNKRND